MEPWDEYYDWPDEEEQSLAEQIRCEDAWQDGQEAIERQKERVS